MAGTTTKSKQSQKIDTDVGQLVVQYNKAVDDLETIRSVASSCVVAVTELIADHATFKTAVDGTETLVEELHDDHATFKTIVDEIKTDYTALLADVTAIRAVLAGVVSGSATWDPGNLLDGAGETSASITATGAALGDFVLVSAPYDLQGVTCNAYVDATNSVKVRLQNETGVAVDLALGTWRVRVIPQASFAAPAALTATAITASSPATLTAAKPASAPATLTASAPSATAIDLAADLTAAKIGNMAGTAFTATTY